MPTKLLEKAVEGSTFMIRVEFNESTPAGPLPVIPKAGLKWGLREKDGTVVNSRENQVITPAATVDITLSGNDLALSGGRPLRRYLTIEGTYDGLAGNDLPIIDEASFQIYNLVGIS